MSAPQAQASLLAHIPSGSVAIRATDLSLDEARLRFFKHPSGCLALVYLFDGPAPLVGGDTRGVTFHDEARCVGYVVGLYPA